MPQLSVDGVDLYYELHGSGSPLMLVAGLASDSQSWQPVVGELSRRFLVITPDNRGSGRTAPQSCEIAIGRMADDCAALADHLGLPSVNLLGHSMGGFVALELAARHPRRVDRLILAGTSSSNSRRNNALFADWAASLESGTDPARWFRNIFYWIFSARFFEDQTLVEDALRFAVDYPYPQSSAAFRGQIDAIARYNGNSGLKAVGSKTLVISGSEDLLFPPETGVELAQAIPNARHSVIEGAAHSIHMEQPGAFMDRIFDFLSDRKMP